MIKTTSGSCEIYAELGNGHASHFGLRASATAPILLGLRATVL